MQELQQVRCSNKLYQTRLIEQELTGPDTARYLLYLLYWGGGGEYHNIGKEENGEKGKKKRKEKIKA